MTFTLQSTLVTARYGPPLAVHLLLSGHFGCMVESVLQLRADEEVDESQVGVGCMWRRASMPRPMVSRLGVCGIYLTATGRLADRQPAVHRQCMPEQNMAMQQGAGPAVCGLPETSDHCPSLQALLLLACAHNVSHGLHSAAQAVLDSEGAADDTTQTPRPPWPPSGQHSETWTVS